jgi:tetratricopeptide (TPR) repeat protein
MLFTLIVFFIGPIVLLIGLGVLSNYLTFSGYFPGNTRIGWTLLGVALAVFLFPLIFMLRSEQAAGVGMLAHIVFLCLLLALQAPLLAELITLIPDRSRGLKVLKVHSEAERRVNDDDLPGAIEEFDRIIAEDPHDLEARFRLAEICCRSNEYRRAATTYEALLKSAKKLEISSHCVALTRLSEIYAQHLGDVGRAREIINTIIEKYPDTKYARYAKERLSTF